ncbi:MAG TPA: dienelactone hydrolase family protein [Acetobacteraceae bacterium]|nr:dienelactone hydrolase family protein [Acetobacteraceae bacterium]
MPGTWIHIGDGFRGYLAVPECGAGPGLLLLQEIFGVNAHMRDIADLYAEEGYVVLAPDLFCRIAPGTELGNSDADLAHALALYQRFDVAQATRDIATARDCLRARPECTGRIGALGFCLGGLLAYLAAARCGVDAAVGYYGVKIEQYLDEAASIVCPLVLHFGEHDALVPPEKREAIAAALSSHSGAQIFVYPGCDHAFNNPGRPSFDKAASLMAHSRSIAVLRQAMGPHYDLSTLWEQHTGLEFGARDAEATMRTMVAQPYVNHIPVMTGGVGHDELLRFYKHHFIPRTPADTKLIPISRTIGADRVVDEMVFCFTHDIEIDWMLPGVPPTGRYVEIPLVAIVRFRGDKLYNEHIYWDQASVLAQIGLLDTERLPVAGVATARKLLDEELPSNTRMARWAESAGR